MTFIAKALVSALALASLSAWADGPFYMGGSIGTSRYKGDDIGGLGTDKSSNGGKLYGGYSFTPNFGLELGYADLGKFSSPAGEVKGNGVFLDAVGTLPFTPNFSGLVRVGAFNGKTDSTLAGSERGTSYKFGAGVQYDFNKNLGLRAEAERYRFKAFGAKPSTDLYSIGVNYKF
ncbi:MAG TPA: outer membrane beta-barrel protein [Albitalea sp.]|nr:outer membrane beta-barrel protein [Albitalea sp.]HJW11921.1 outer membrane beta-barrel protein [Albitalea sp.]